MNYALIINILNIKNNKKKKKKNKDNNRKRLPFEQLCRC